MRVSSEYIKRCMLLSLTSMAGRTSRVTLGYVINTLKCSASCSTLSFFGGGYILNMHSRMACTSVARLIGVTIKSQFYKVVIIEPSLISLMQLSRCTIIANAHALGKPPTINYSHVVVWFPDCLFRGGGS